MYWILNGPNLNRLGRRKPEIYGTLSMEQVVVDIQRTYPALHFQYRQSNHEGDLIDWLQHLTDTPADCQGIVLNAGGLSHTSVSLRDAVEEACEMLIEQFSTMEYTGLTGTMRWDETGAVNKLPAAYVIKDGAYVPLGE